MNDHVLHGFFLPYNAPNFKSRDDVVAIVIQRRLKKKRQQPKTKRVGLYKAKCYVHGYMRKDLARTRKDMTQDKATSVKRDHPQQSLRTPTFGAVDHHSNLASPSTHSSSSSSSIMARLFNKSPMRPYTSLRLDSNNLCFCSGDKLESDREVLRE